MVVLAHHFLAAGALGVPAKAVAYTRAAGDYFLAETSYDRAAWFYGESLHLLIDSSVTNERVRDDLGDVAVAEIEPSLEDVFVRLTETRGREVEAGRIA